MKYKKSLAWIALFVLMGLLVLPTHRVLAVIDVKQNRPVLYANMANHEEFVIRFIHSVNKRPVYDYIEAEDEHLKVTRSRYDAFGAGMPEMSIDGMTLISEKDGMMELANINRRLKDFTVFVGTVANHSLIIRSQEISLSDLAKPGDPLKFAMANVSYYQLWKGRCIR